MTNRIATTTLLALSLAAAGAPAASAEFLGPDPGPVVTPTRAAVYSHPDKTMVPVSSPASGAAIAKATAQPPAVRVVASNGSFDWGDAGIGAASGLTLSVIAFGGGIAVSQRRSRRTTALPS